MTFGRKLGALAADIIRLFLRAGQWPIPTELNGRPSSLPPPNWCERHYIVSFTMGNSTPVADLMVGLPDGRQFWVDVKGLSSKNAWLVKRKKPRDNLFYILVHVGAQKRVHDRFFIMTQTDTNALVADYLAKHPNAKPVDSFNWTDPFPHEDHWHILPKVEAA